MKCIIVDDDELSCLNLKRLCKKVDDLEVVAICNDGFEAINILKNKKVDFIFLDIIMPELSGMDMVKSIPNLPPVIFTTGRDDMAVEAFENEIIDYLVKPIELPRFLKSYNRVRNYISDKNSESEKTEIYARSRGKLVRIGFSDVLLIETLDDYVVFKMENGNSHVVHSTLKNMAVKLEGTTFLKIHRSYIVNISKIDSIEEGFVKITDLLIPISRLHKQELLDKVNLL
jgi:two-component system, LytTR family, response regulator LytT